jgi:hypothetical protein
MFILYTCAGWQKPLLQGLTLSHTVPRAIPWTLSWSFLSYIFRRSVLLLDFAFLFFNISCIVLTYGCLISATWWICAVYIEKVRGYGNFFPFMISVKYGLLNSVLYNICWLCYVSCLLRLIIIFWRKPDHQTIKRFLNRNCYLIVMWVCMNMQCAKC